MTFEQENEQLLQDILENSFYAGFKDEAKKRYESSCLEMNITASCNQKCEYCYLTKYGDSLYPADIRKEDNILKNMELLIDYFLENQMHPGYLDLFSGEIWGTPFGNQVFDKIMDGIRRGWGIRYIMIASNMSFLMDKKRFENVERYIAAFKESGCRLVFSASVDGLFLDETQRSFREKKKNNDRTPDFYAKLFSWCKEKHYAFHPMVAAHGIEHWIENYKWWQHMFAKYHLNPFEYGMYLEVRNDEWTIEKIDHYLNFVNFMMDYDFRELCGGEMETFVRESIEHSISDKGYFPYVLLNTGNTYNCTVNTALTVRMGDLAIGPCHRTHYEPFLYGKYRVKNGKIDGIDANNVQLANLILNGAHDKTMMQCEKCPVSHICMRGCLGAQYESSGEILKPCPTVCQLQKARIIFLYLKYTSMGIFDFIERSNDIQKRNYVDYFKECALNLKEGEPNLWNYWEIKTNQKIY